MPNIGLVEVLGQVRISVEMSAANCSICAPGLTILGAFLWGCLSRGMVLVLDVGHQLLDLSLLVTGQWQERQSCGAAVVSIEVHCIFHARNAQAACNPLGSIG